MGQGRRPTTLSLEAATYPRLEELAVEVTRLVRMRFWPSDIVDLLVWGADAEQVVRLLRRHTLAAASEALGEGDGEGAAGQG